MIGGLIAGLIARPAMHVALRQGAAALAVLLTSSPFAGPANAPAGSALSAPARIGRVASFMSSDRMLADDSRPSISAPRDSRVRMDAGILPFMRCSLDGAPTESPATLGLHRCGGRRLQGLRPRTAACAPFTAPVSISAPTSVTRSVANARDLLTRSPSAAISTNSPGSILLSVIIRRAALLLQGTPTQLILRFRLQILQPEPQPNTGDRRPAEPRPYVGLRQGLHAPPHYAPPAGALPRRLQARRSD